VINTLSTVKTPCIGVCSTGIGDSVCRGCKRFTKEVIDWNGYSEDQKLAVMGRIEALLAQVVAAKLLILDEQLLKQGVELQQVRTGGKKNPYTWVFDLLKEGAGQIRDLSDYGCKLMPEWRDRPLVELRDAIDADFFTLSCAHYERYFLFHQSR